METKLIAAEIATSAGVSTVVTTSKIPENIFNIIEYITVNGSSPKLDPVIVSQSSPPPDPNPNAPQPPLVARPPHTLFTPSNLPLSDLKAWTTHTLTPAGSVIVDSGAYRVLSRRESGGRLLAAGVLAVQGSFASGQAVRILIRRIPDSVSNHSTGDAKFTYHHDLSTPATRPSTPKLGPMYVPDSMSSSISSIDVFSRHASFTAISISAATNARDDVTSNAVSHSTAIPAPIQELEEQTLTGDLDASETGWEHIEVGRGLANYNSAEIRKVRGCKRLVLKCCCVS